MEFHHIGIACADIESTQLHIEKIYNIDKVSEVLFDELQNASLCMVTLKGGAKMELVSGKIVEKIVKKRQFLYHICYSTKDIVAKIKEFEESGAKIVSELKAAKLFGGRRVAFLMTPIGLIELLECE